VPNRDGLLTGDPVFWQRRNPIKVSDFMTVFRDGGIRSWLDWEMVQSPDYSVVEIFSRSVADVSRLETVWCIRADGSLGDWRNQDDRRVSVKDAAARRDFPSQASEQYIQELISGMRASPAPPYLVLPCYRTQSGKFIMLDGNHRAVAACRSGMDVRLLIFALSGPDDPLLLPELLRELDPEPSAELWAHYQAEIERKFAGS
jgi:hypothetical protein